MPQPTYAIVSGKVVCKFGGRPLPIIGTTMGYLDLNDKTNWRLRDFKTKSSLSRAYAARPFQARAVPQSSDAAPKVITLTSIFDEVGGSTLASQKALLEQSDEQFLTFDNVTGTLCRLVDYGDPSTIQTFPPYLWNLALQFLALDGTQDLSVTTVAPFAVSGSTGAGSVTNFNVTYAGSVKGRPTFVFTVGATNPATISQIKLQNTTPTGGEITTVNFSPVLAASTAWVITIDCDGWHITDGAGNEYDQAGGAFPQLYGPVGTVNAYSFTVVTGTGALSNSTLGATYFNRWVL